MSMWRAAVANPDHRASRAELSPATNHEIFRRTSRVTAPLCHAARPTWGRAAFVLPPALTDSADLNGPGRLTDRIT